MENIASISATLPGGFSSLWVNQKKPALAINCDVAMPTTVQSGHTQPELTVVEAGYVQHQLQDDRRYNSHYYTADYYQNVYRVPLVRLACGPVFSAITTATERQYREIYRSRSLATTGQLVSAGMTHQNGYTMANLSARKHLMKEPFALLVPICHEPSPANR